MSNVGFMRMIKRLMVMITMCWAMNGIAQTVVWQMQPENYDEIKRINTNLYLASRNGKIGLISSDGSVIAAVENDELSLFHEDKALLTKTEGIGERISGCLTADGKFLSFPYPYYVISGQKFYSDGLLSVKDEDGYLGYIDQFGNRVLGFDGKYDKIKPFSEGYAAVFKNKKYHLIDKEGIPVKFRFKNIGQVLSGTNVYNGLAYIMDTDGKFYSYNVKSDDYLKGLKKPKSTSYDYLYRLSSVSGAGKDVPFISVDRRGELGLNPIESDSRFGFYFDQIPVLPCQLSSATVFEDGMSVVGINGELGILRFIGNENFSVSIPNSSHNFYAGDKLDCRFVMSIPQSWRDRNYQVMLKDEDGTVFPATQGINDFSFAYSPSQTGVKKFSVYVVGEGLNLFESELSYSFTKKVKCPVCGKDKDKCAGHETKQTVDKKQNVAVCPDCGLPIKDCVYKGVH